MSSLVCKRCGHKVDTFDEIVLAQKIKLQLCPLCGGVQPSENHINIVKAGEFYCSKCSEHLYHFQVFRIKNVIYCSVCGSSNLIRQ
jgi:NAD-dependent SIR2 family protein deacetylase